MCQRILYVRSDIFLCFDKGVDILLWFKELDFILQEL